MPEGRLVVCATPIGNLGDVSERLRATLSEADVVYAEDTRRTGRLLEAIGADTPMRSMFEGNEAARTEDLIAELKQGRTVALVTDAGMPSVSDPGARAVARATSEGLAVTIIPGPSAVTSALALSGFGADRFVFEGFLPRRGEERARRLERLAGEDRPVVVFASPKRLADDLADLARHVGGSRRVAVAREISKIHEEVWVGPLDEAVRHWAGEAKGEITIVLDAGEVHAMSGSEAVALARVLIEGGATLSEAAREASAESGVSRRVIYQALLEDHGES